MHSIKYATLLALAAFITQSSAASCEITWDGSSFYHDHYISASGVENIPTVCGDLWYQLRCPVPSRTSCRDAGDGTLIWQFTTGVSCNAGDVESAWWRATRNTFGGIDCD
ncbi:hypothetical protein BDW59DRAFT_154898 [Aspergillus cavernicola]|uniref:Uncharacterized protein n=1 Tax=Aspergillus cavernicola TaxID=176166 RepID=A0ABR4HD20_9EURO